MSKHWKAAERAIAAKLGGKRCPITGRQRGDVPDIAHEWLSIEVKERQQLPGWVQMALVQARAAAKQGQLAIAVLHELGERYDDALVVLRLSDFNEWFGGEKK